MKYLLVAHPSPGLIHDQRVVHDVLIKKGHTVVSINPRLELGFKRIPLPLPDDLVTESVVILFEHLFYFSVKPKLTLFIPNPEWLSASEVDAIKTDYSLDGFLLKSLDATERFRSFFPGISSTYLGFKSVLSCPISDSSPNYNRAVHIRGYSRQKGTRQVIDCYRKPRPHTLPPCVVTMRCFDDAIPDFAANITSNMKLLFGELTSSQIFSLMSKRGLHICPSEMEGFGHYIFEAMLLSAFIVTMDVAPMNELISPESGLLVACKKIQYDLHDKAVIDVEFLRECLEFAYSLNCDAKKSMGGKARQKALDLARQFDDNLALLAEYIDCI